MASSASVGSGGEAGSFEPDREAMLRVLYESIRMSTKYFVYKRPPQSATAGRVYAGRAWGSLIMTERIMDRARFDRKSSFQSLSYDDAGHTSHNPPPGLYFGQSRLGGRRRTSRANRSLTGRQP